MISMILRLFLLASIISLSSCVIPRQEWVYYGQKPQRLKAKCVYKIEEKIGFCKGEYFLTNKIQPFSKVKIEDKKSGKSIVISTRKGNKSCIPEKYKRFFNSEDYIVANIRVLRCGKKNIGKCPPSIEGFASWYGGKFHGRKTASGIRFNMYGMYAAHRTLPLGTILEVTNLENGRKVRVKVIDRGPFVRGRNLDLSYGAAKKLGMLKKGVIPYRAIVLRCGY